MDTKTRELLSGYFDWLRANSSEVTLDGDWIELTLPFLDRHNDHLQVYAQFRRDGIYMTDDGQVVRDLKQSGCPLNTPKRRLLAETILNCLGLDAGSVGDEELRANASTDDFPAKLHSLLQAMLAVGGLANTAPSIVETIFREDVSAWLDVQGVDYEFGARYEGDTGLVHEFDFRIPPSDTQPERIVQTITTPDRTHIQSFTFSAIDTKSTRPRGSRIYAVLDDRHRKVGKKLPMALMRNDISPIKWSKREQYIPQLTN